MSLKINKLNRNEVRFLGCAATVNVRFLTQESAQSPTRFLRLPSRSKLIFDDLALCLERMNRGFFYVSCLGRAASKHVQTRGHIA